MEEIIAAVIAVAVSIIGAGGSMLVSWLNKRRAQSDIDALRQAVEGFQRGDGEGAEHAMAIHMRHSMDVMGL